MPRPVSCTNLTPTIQFHTRRPSTGRTEPDPARQPTLVHRIKGDQTMNARVIKIILASVFLIAAIALIAWYTGIGSGNTVTVESESGPAQLPKSID